MKINVVELAEKLSDAYSTDRYAGGWSASIKMLARRGYNEQEIEAILRSKWTRWAGDASGKSRRVNSADLAKWLDVMPNLKKEVAKLVAETFEEVRSC